MHSGVFEQLNRIKGVIFDLDGTLLDSMRMWQQIDHDFLNRRGIALPPDYQDAVTPLGARDAAHYTIARFNLQESPEDLMAEWAEMSYCHYRDDLELLPFALDYVRALQREGIPMTIATSSDHRSVSAACERTGLSPYIRRIVTVAEIGRGKKFSDIYLACAKTMGVDPSVCAVFEDIFEGLKTAKKAGFYTVAKINEEYSQKDELQKEADCCIRSFEELLT